MLRINAASGVARAFSSAIRFSRAARIRAFHELVDHHHVHVGCAGGQVIPEPRRPLDDIDLCADEPRRLGELRLQVDAVVDEYNLEILQLSSQGPQADRERASRRTGTRSLLFPFEDGYAFL